MGIGQRSRYQVRQLVGACNSRPAPEVAKAVGTFVEEINKGLPAEEGAHRQGLGEGPADRTRPARSRLAMSP